MRSTTSFDGTFFRVVPGETPEVVTEVPAASNPISLGSYLGVSSTDQQHFYLLDENGLYLANSIVNSPFPFVAERKSVA